MHRYCKSYTLAKTSTLTMEKSLHQNKKKCPTINVQSIYSTEIQDEHPYQEPPAEHFVLSFQLVNGRPNINVHGHRNDRHGLPKDVASPIPQDHLA